MQKVNRLIFISLLTAIMTGGVWAKEPVQETPQTAEYNRGDTNFYPKAEVVKAHPSAIILPGGSFTQKGDSYFFTPKKKAPKEVYLEALNDWIEPITPPGATSLGIAPDAMQIREPRGDVRVAFPSAPANFFPVTDGMTLPNGAVMKTGANGTAAVLFGGVDSARLIPNSAAAVQQTVTAQSRSVEVDLTTGGVFSKVGTQVGVKGDYGVHTPFGNAVAHGGDFVTITTSGRTDVWIAQGTASLELPNSKAAETAMSDGTGALKIIRFPLIADPHQALVADAETLTTTLNFIPLANQKIKALRDKKANGATLTANERAYLGRIKQVPCLIKLALVEPPPPVIITPPPMAPAPAPAPAPPVASAPTAAPAPPSPANLKPISVVVHADGTVKFQGATLGLAEFQLKLETMVQATPDQSLVIKPAETVPNEKLKEVLDICATAHVKHVSVATPTPALATTPAPTPTPAPAPPPQPPPSPAPAAVSTPTTAPAPQALSTGEMVPVEIHLRPDGNVDLEGQTMSLYELKWRLSTITNANTALSVVITGQENASHDQLEKVLAIFKAANVKHVSVGTPAPAPPSQPPPAPAPAAVSAPATAPAPPPPASPGPIRAVVRMDGKINFQGATYELPGFKSKLEALMKTTPDQSIVLKAGKNVPYEKFQAALDICHSAEVKNLTVVAPTPTPTSAPAPAPASAAPVATTPPIPSPAPPSAGNLHHSDNVVFVNPDGTVKFQGATLDLTNFESKLKAAVKTTPDQSFVIEAGTDVPYEKIKAVLGSFADAKVDKVSVDINASGPPPTAPTNPTPPATNPPVPPAASAPAAVPAPSSPANSGPIRATVRMDGKINFQGATYELPGFKSKLEALMKATPDQSIVLKAGKNVPYENFRAALDICHSAGVKNLTIATPAPTPGSAAAEPAANLPTPGLLMHSPDDSMSSNAPPMSPSGLSAPTPSTPSTPASGSP